MKIGAEYAKYIEQYIAAYQYDTSGKIAVCPIFVLGEFDPEGGTKVKRRIMSFILIATMLSLALSNVYVIDVYGSNASIVEATAASYENAETTEERYPYVTSGNFVVYQDFDMQAGIVKYSVYDSSKKELVTDSVWDSAVAAPNGSLYLGLYNDDAWTYQIMDSERVLTQSPITNRIYRVDSDGYIITAKVISVTYTNCYYGGESIGEMIQYGLVAPDGTIILDPVVESGVGLYSAEPFQFVNDRAIIQTGSTEYITYHDNPRYGFYGNGMYGIIDKSGSYISASDFDRIMYRGGGRFLGMRGDRYYVIGMDGAETSATADADSIISEWAKKETDEAIAEGLVPQILQGYYTFNVTRQEFCMLAVTLYEKRKGEIALENEDINFTDTTDQTVRKAASIGVIKGYGDGSFRPYRSISREEAATMLGRLYSLFADLPRYTGEAYADNNGISDFAKEYVDGIRQARIMHGSEVKGTNESVMYFHPKSGYSIEQAIATMLRLYKVVEE